MQKETFFLKKTGNPFDLHQKVVLLHVQNEKYISINPIKN